MVHTASAGSRSRANHGEAAASWFALEDVQRSSLLGQRIAAEAWSFWARRLRAWAEYADAMSSCRNPADWAAAQSRFMSGAQVDWAEESRLFAHLAADDAPGEAARDAAVSAGRNRSAN